MNKTTKTIITSSVITAGVAVAIALVATANPCPIPAGVTGNVICVAPSGSDTNAGTVDAPYKTIAKAITASQPTDTILVGSGTYPSFTISKSNVRLIGVGRPLVSGGYGIKCNANSKNVQISGFEVTGATGNYTGAIYLNNCSGSTVSDNLVHDNISATVSGIIVYGNDNHILSNVVYNNNFSGIRIYGNSANNEIAFNKFYNHTLSAGNSDGIDLVDPTVTGTIIHDNEVWGNSDDGIDTWTSPANTVKNNISHNNGGTGDGNGIKLGGLTSGGNNIVIGNVSYANETSGFTSNGNGNYYEGNIAYGNGEYGFSDGWRNAGNTTKSSFVKNYAWSNAKGNFKYSSAYLIDFTNNLETAITFFPGTVLPETMTPISNLTVVISTNTLITTTDTPIPPTKTAIPATSTPTKAPSKITVNGTVIPCPCVISVP